MTELMFLEQLMLWKKYIKRYFLSYSFTFQRNVCNRCHNLLIISINFSDIAILNIQGSDYCHIITLISRNEAIKLRLL